MAHSGFGRGAGRQGSHRRLVFEHYYHVTTTFDLNPLEETFQGVDPNFTDGVPGFASSVFPNFDAQATPAFAEENTTDSEIELTIPTEQQEIGNTDLSQDLDSISAVEEHIATLESQLKSAKEQLAVLKREDKEEGPLRKRKHSDEGSGSGSSTKVAKQKEGSTASATARLFAKLARKEKQKATVSADHDGLQFGR